MPTERSVSNKLHTIKSIFEGNQDLSFKIFNKMPIGICVTNADGIFTDVNKTYLNIYGYEREEMIGKNFTMVVPKDSVQELNHLHSQFMGKKYELSGRWTVQSKSKEQFEVLTNAAYLTANEEREASKMTFVVKATELQETILKLQKVVAILESKLQAQDNAADISEHQMRNRLGSIVTMANILEKTELNDMQRKWVKLIRNAGQDTLDMLDTTKDFVQMERGVYQPKFSNFDVLDVIKQVEEDLEQMQLSCDSTIEILFNGKMLDYDSELTIDADKVYIKHLFKNLISNAIEAAPNGSKISVDTIADKKKSSIMFSIHNPGVIPEGIQDTFFQKYSTSGKAKGTGLGTYVAQMIAQVHGGDISFVTSEVEGTTLFVTLPKEQ
jgi:PAS domain S-box-containing protein